MKSIKINVLIFLLGTILYSSCVEDPMASEQYQKDIYIIGANKDVSSFNLPYGDAQEAFISLSASGTHKVDRDVEIALKEAVGIIDKYNNKYLLDAAVKYRALPSDLVNIPSWKTTLKAGDIYTHLPFSISSSGLHCDSLYALTFEIESVSDYQIKESGKKMIFTLKLVNDFSGDYQMKATTMSLIENADGSWVEDGSPTPIEIPRTLTACSAKEVRFFHGTTRQTLSEYSSSWEPGKDYFDAIKNYCIKFVQVNDSNKFTIEPWGAMEIIGGEAEYKKDEFSFWYDYMDDSERYRMKGTFKK